MILRNGALENAEYYFRLSQDKSYSLATRRCFETVMYTHLLYWAGGWREE